jgi:hypothetical protein
MLGRGFVQDKGLPQPKTPFAPTIRKNPATGHDVVLITNRDLEKLYGPKQGAAPPRRPGDSGPAGAPGQPGAAPEETAPAAAKAEDLGAQASAIQSEMARLQQKVTHLKNPYSRPQPGAEQDRVADQGKSATERINESQERLKTLQSQLKALQEKQAAGSSGQGQR